MATYCAATNVALFELPETVAIGVSLVDFSQCNVHKVVTVDEVTIQRLAILEFDKLKEHSVQ